MKRIKVSNFILLVIVLGLTIVQQRRRLTQIHTIIEAAALTTTSADGAINLTIITPPQPNKSKNGWCVIDDDNSEHLIMFQHALTTIVACWSWFSENQYTAEGNRCGFYLNSTKRKLGNKWILKLIHVTGCTSIRPVHKPPPDGDVSHRVDCLPHNTTSWFDRYENRSYFGRPSHAAALRKRLELYDDDDEAANRTIVVTADRVFIKIALIDRQSNRKILNIEDVREALISRFPSDTTTVSEVVYMENMTILEQFRLFSRNNIIIAAHGAAISNAVFLNGALIELYPPNYYPVPFFKDLIVSAGNRHYGYYYGLSEQEAFQVTRNISKGLGYYLRGQNFNASVPSVLQLVSTARNEMLLARDDP